MNNSQANLIANLRALPRGAWILFFGTFLNKFGTFVVPFLAIYVTRLGYSTAQAGIPMAAYGIGTLVASLLGGHLADRLGRRKTIVLSMSSVAVVMIWLSQARSLPGIVALSALAGLTGELYRPACSALLADLVPAGQRVTAFAAYRMALNAGFAFGPATAGLLAKTSFTWLFVGDAITSLLFGLVAWFALPAGLRNERAAGSLAETLRVVRSDPNFRRVLASSLVVGLVFVQVFSSMSLAITSSGHSTSVYGFIISLNGALVVLFELPIAAITGRLHARRVMAFGYLLIGLGFASNLLPRTIPLLVLTTILFTAGEMVSMPVSGAYVADLAPAHQRGLYMGLYGLTWSLAFVCGPSLGLWLFQASPITLWTLCGLLGALAAFLISASPGPRPVPATARAPA